MALVPLIPLRSWSLPLSLLTSWAWATVGSDTDQISMFPFLWTPGHCYKALSSQLDAMDKVKTISMSSYSTIHIHRFPPFLPPSLPSRRFIITGTDLTTLLSKPCTASCPGTTQA
jgi:hypothetical protein